MHGDAERRFEDLPAHVEDFVGHWVARTRRRGPGARRFAEQAARASVEQMIRLIVPGFRGRRRILGWPFRVSAPGLLSYLKEERGLSPRTIVIHGHYLRQLESHMRDAGIADLADLSPARVSEFFVVLSRRVGQLSISVCASVVRTFLRFAEREGLVPANLARSVDRPRTYRLARVPRSISWTDVQRLLESVDRSRAVGKPDYAILVFLYNTGARVQEVADLRVEHLDLERGPRVRLHGKGDKWRTCPLWEDTARLLRPLIAERDRDDPVFSAAAGRPLTRFGIYKIVRRHSAKIDCIPASGRRISPHVFRHTTAVHLLEAGVEVNVIRGWLGHAGLATTNRYADINARVKEAALRLTEPPAHSGDHASTRPSWRHDSALLSWLGAL